MRTTPAILALLVLGTLATGCGGGDPSTPLGRGGTGPERKAVTVAALGDSISAGSPLWDPDPRVRAALGSPDRQSQYEYWVERRLPAASFRNCGVFGERTDEIARRLDRCADGADVLVVQGGINDIAQMRRVRTAARNLRAMVRRGRRLGLEVMLVEVLPWNNGGRIAAPRIRRLNEAIREIGRDEDVTVLPWYRTLEDREAPGRMRTDWTIDGNHPSVEGYRRLAETFELP